MTEPEVGRLIGGKFVIEGVLGRGGMGVVYAARNMDLDQRVAVKCLLPELVAVPEVLERFAREARAAVRIQGEHVARVLDVGRSDDGVPFIVMEYLEGHDLAQELVSRGALGISEAVTYILQACEAIAQAHALRIVHRDLKPSNLFLTATPGRDRFVKVLDFGISKVVDPKASQLTHTTTLMGTPYYMSPEQLLAAKTVDERSDIWSLGVILYELVTAISPFAADTGPEVVAKIVQNVPLPPTRLRPDVPAGLEAVILRCLQARPEARFQDVGALARALAPFATAGDRPSIDAISRVVSDSLQALAAGDTAFAQPSSSVMPPALGREAFPAGPVSAPSPSAPARGVPTVAGKLADLVDPAPWRGRTALGGLLVALFLGLSVVVVAKLTGSAPVAPSAVGPGSSVAAVAPDPVASSAPSASALSDAPQPPSTGAPASVVAAPPAGPTPAQSPLAPALAPATSPTPRIAPPAVSAPSPPSPSTPPRARPPKKNPLDIPIQ